MRISARRLQRTISELSEIGRQTDGGLTRLTFSRADMEARRYVTDLIGDAGMFTYLDEFGNIIGRTNQIEDDTPTVACGSHIDTVPNGGSLDGAYGVLAGIEAIRNLHSKYAGKNAFQIMIFTEEEGTRFGAFIGSRGFTGLLSKKAAYELKDREGLAFGDVFARQSMAGLPKINSRMARNIRSYVELHIEQGPILEYEHISVGVVESIVGLADLTIEVIGETGHAGTTPMRLRHDALVGAARIILGIQEIANDRAGNGVATIGSLAVEPGAANVIPGRVTITVDYRSPSVRGMKLLQRKIVSLSNRVGAQNNLRIITRLENLTKPARMSSRIVTLIENSANSLGLSRKRMQSGAGHDCQNMARLTETGMIFVPSHRGVSHAPNEYTKPKHLEAGANVLLETLVGLSKS